MLRHHKCGNSNRLWRLVHIVPAVFVFSYIALIFDLDLSDFHLRMKPSLLDPSIFNESISLQHKEKLTNSIAFPCGRIYVLRLTLPRSSSLDSFPCCLTLHPFQFIPPPEDSEEEFQQGWSVTLCRD